MEGFECPIVYFGGNYIQNISPLSNFEGIVFQGDFEINDRERGLGETQKTCQMGLNATMGVEEEDLGLFGLQFSTKDQRKFIQKVLEGQAFLNEGLSCQHSVIHKVLVSYQHQLVVETNVTQDTVKHRRSQKALEAFTKKGKNKNGRVSLLGGYLQRH